MREQVHEVLLKSLFVSITWKDPSPVDMSVKYVWHAPATIFDFSGNISDEGACNEWRRWTRIN